MDTIAEMMIEYERAAGRQPVRPGSRRWLRKADWIGMPVVVESSEEIHVVAVAARKPKSGALSRVISGIEMEGKRPVIVEPMGSDMPQILKKWGWECSVVGSGCTRREQWTPRGSN